MIGYLLTTFNDSEEAVNAYQSLLKSIPAGERFKIVVVDGGSSEEHITRIQQNIGECIGPEKNLSAALNTGIYRILGYFPDNIQNFVKTGLSDVAHVIWVHTDQHYPDFDWGNKLKFCYDFCYPLIGRLGPATHNIDGSDPNVNVLYSCNQCPWIMSSETIKKTIEKYGNIYNPEYINIGGLEDWDHGRRLATLGYGFARCNLIDCWHAGMGTRGKRDTRAEQIHNREVYYKIWGTWEQPGFDVDMTELGKELRFEFEKKFTKTWYQNTCNS